VVDIQLHDVSGLVLATISSLASSILDLCCLLWVQNLIVERTCLALVHDLRQLQA